MISPDATFGLHKFLSISFLSQLKTIFRGYRRACSFVGLIDQRLVDCLTDGDKGGTCKSGLRPRCFPRLGASRSVRLVIETLRSAGPLAWVLLILALINLALLIVTLLILMLDVRALNNLPRSETGSSSRARSSPETSATQIDLATVVMDDLARIDELEVYARVVEEQQCTICLEEMLDGGVKTLLCRHEFHEECIDAWLNDHTTCLICRATLLI